MTEPTPAERSRELIEAATAPDATPEALVEFDELWGPMAGLCAEDPAVREELQDLRPALAGVAEELEGAQWIELALSVLHREPFVALEPASGRGLVGRMSGVVDGFQLRTLLMDEFPRQPGEAPRVSAAVAANARGEGPQALETFVQGVWDMHTHLGLVDGRLPAGVDGRAHWIWNEGRPEDIPVFEGHRVVLLGPASYDRGYDASRAFPGLRATLDATVLEPEGAAAWLERLGAAPPDPPARRRPWPFGRRRPASGSGG